MICALCTVIAIMMEGFCRGCLLQCSDLLQYTERNRRLFIYSTGLQVKRNDTFTFQLCKQCYISMRQSCKFKKQCRTVDMKFRNYLMLKEDGDDFGNYLKNIDAHGSLRLPLTSGHSTPAYKKDKDDDNESTCTSIRNFMTEILDGEEMAPTEERIIREVIEEEADVLDDSLDSHWLEDEQSVGSDVEMDFGSSPFATPRLGHNDHCYTPVKINEGKHNEINFFTSKNIIEEIEPRTPNKYDMPIIEDMNMEFENKDLDENDLDANDVDKIPIRSPVEFNNSIPSEVEDMVTENSISSTIQCFKTDLLKDLAIKKEMDILDSETNLFDDASKDSSNIKLETTDEGDYGIVLNQGTAEKNISNDLEYYVNKANFKKQLISSKHSTKVYHCTIDRNLDIALKNEENTKFALDQLIISPAVSFKSDESTPTVRNILFGEKDHGTAKYAASTPMIENILFGDKLDSQTPPKYFPQVGQDITEDNCDFSEKDTKLNITAITIKEKVEIEKNKREKMDDDLDEILDSCLQEHNFSPIIRENLNTDNIPKEINNDVTNNEHMNILEEFLQGADDTLKIDDEIIEQIIDPDELKDQDLFKRPLTPLFDKYDIDKCYCKICKRTFASQKALKIHFAKFHKYKFPNDDPHRNKSQRQKVIVCNICGKEIKGASHYAEHRRNHEMNDTTVKCQCDYCKHFFESRRALLVHITKMHLKLKTKSKKHVCHICGKVSRTSTHHKIHQRRHLKEFSFFCEICNKGFYEQYAMKVHMRIHQGDCPYSCEHCPMMYRSRDAFMQHMNRHLGKFEYKCDVCKKEYVTAKHLAKHYSSNACLKTRERASKKKKPKEKVTVSFGKGSLDKIKKMMQSNTNTQMEYNSEIEDVDLKSVENNGIEENESKEIKDTSLDKEVNVSKEIQDKSLLEVNKSLKSVENVEMEKNESKEIKDTSLDKEVNVSKEIQDTSLLEVNKSLKPVKNVEN